MHFFDTIPDLVFKTKRFLLLDLRRDGLKYLDIVSNQVFSTRRLLRGELHSFCTIPDLVFKTRWVLREGIHFFNTIFETIFKTECFLLFDLRSDGLKYIEIAPNQVFNTKRFLWRDLWREGRT